MPFNLLNNAAKYTDANGHIDLTVEQDNGWVVIRVRDEGAGIAPDLLPKVFDLFTQGDHTLDRAQGGLGIGLTLVRHVVELHGGTVGARSEGPGRGSEFLVRLPVFSGTPAGAGPDGPSEAERGSNPLSILLVEDNPDSAATMQEVLEGWGHTVHVCPDGPSALSTAKEIHPNVVLLDIGLPLMDGYEVARRLRHDLGLTETPIVALTGYGQEQDRAESREAGFDAHLVKPVDMVSLRCLLTDAAKASM